MLVVHRNTEGKVVSEVAENACRQMGSPAPYIFFLVLGRKDRSGTRSGRLYPEDTTVFTRRVQAHMGHVEEKILLVQGI